MSTVTESSTEQLETLFDQVEPVPEQVEPASVQTAASLLSGIIGDLQHLVQQQFQLTRMQVADELRGRVAAVAVLSGGVLSLLVSAIFLCLSVAHLLHWMTSPSGIDPASLPLWSCHAIVSLVLGLIGGILMSIGQARFRSILPFRNPVTEKIQDKF